MPRKALPHLQEEHCLVRQEPRETEHMIWHCRRASSEKGLPGPARLRSRVSGKRKRAVRDVDANGQPATQIPTNHIRALMADRAPLLKVQKRVSQASVRGTLETFSLVECSPTCATLQLLCASAEGPLWHLRQPTYFCFNAMSVQRKGNAACQVQMQLD